MIVIHMTGKKNGYNFFPGVRTFNVLTCILTVQGEPYLSNDETEFEEH